MTDFYTLADLPADVWNGEDRDNSVLKDAQRVVLTPQLLFEEEKKVLAGVEALAATPPHRLVPFIREVKFNTAGKDCFAIKRALAAAGFGAWGSWGRQEFWFGPFAVKHLKAFQKAHKLKVDGVYGLATHKALSKYYDEYGIWLLHQTHIITPSEKKRQAIVATAFVGYNNRPLVHYTEGHLRMYGVRNHIRPPRFPSYEDCSSYATWCYWVAYAPDPNGLGYNGYGYTGTQVQHGRNISINQAKPGDLVFYGGSFWLPGHVAIYVGNGMVISHGSEIGPLYLPAQYRRITEVRTYF